MTLEEKLSLCIRAEEERKAPHFPLIPEISPQTPPFGGQCLAEHKFLDAEYYQSSSILTRDRFGLGKEEA